MHEILTTQYSCETDAHVCVCGGGVYKNRIGSLVEMLADMKRLNQVSCRLAF